MPNRTALSRQLAKDLPPGVHQLSNADLRRIYGLRRVTAKARREIATELQRVGLQIVGRPDDEPLMVRKTARQGVGSVARSRQVWWRRPWAIGTAAVLLLLIIAGALGDSTTTTPADEAGLAAQATETQPPATTETAPAEPVQSFADAEDAVEDEDFTEAVAIAAAIGDDDRDRIRRKISRTLAKQVRSAVRNGDRSLAKALLADADRYPATPELRAARSSYKAAKARAAERARQRRIARAAARQRAADRRAARRAARAAERAAEAAATAEAESYDAPDTGSSEGGSGNWCGASRDGDGDGIWCEGR